MATSAYPDTNCVRQPFSWSGHWPEQDDGPYLAEINLFLGTSSVRPNQRIRFPVPSSIYGDQHRMPDVVIGCVDTRAARNVIERAVREIVFDRHLLASISATMHRAVSSFSDSQLNQRNRHKAGTGFALSCELYPEIVDSAGGEDPLLQLFGCRRRCLNCRHHSSIRCSP